MWDLFDGKRKVSSSQPKGQPSTEQVSQPANKPVSQPGFRIKYGSVTRTLTREQLEQAPDSLIAKVLLSVETAISGDLVIKCDESPGAWDSGSEELFQVVMDCYTNRPAALTRKISTQRLGEALDGYFAIPHEMWPWKTRLHKYHMDLVDEKNELAHDMIRQMLLLMQTPQLPEYGVSTQPNSVVLKATFTVHQVNPEQGPYVQLASRSNLDKTNMYMDSALEWALTRAAKSLAVELRFYDHWDHYDDVKQRVDYASAPGRAFLFVSTLLAWD